MPSSRISSSLLALSVFTTALAQDCSKVCQSFGKDFVDGGSYFQNSLSTANFTATEYFEGCQADTAYNVLQDPAGEQYQCNNTPLTPDGAIQGLNCPIQKNQLYSGVWSIVVLSNNGQCDPIDYIRTFTLNVGPQQTTTVQPTVVVSSTSIPVITTTSTITRTITSTAPARTTTVRSANPSTVTSTPVATTTVVTRGIVSLTQTVRSPSVVGTTTKTVTSACTVAAQAKVAAKSDPVNTAVRVTVIPGLTIGLQKRDALPEPTARAGSLEYKRAMLEGRLQAEAAQIEQRDIEKRAPDQPTTTITSGAPVTTTTTIVAPTTTLTATTTTQVTTTTTPTVTITSGQNPPATVTAPRPTITNTLIVPLVITTTTRYTTTITATATATKCA